MIDNISGLTPTKQELYINADYDSDDVNDVSEWNGFSINANGICLKMIDVYAQKHGDTSQYSFKWNEWEECLGYKVSDELVNEFGLETLMAVVLWEMTWWGYTAEEVHNNLAESAHALDEVMEESI